MSKPIPVIDLFAGPGGLGEGFSSVVDGHGEAVFKIGVSIEKDVAAHRTLRLRSMFRHMRDCASTDLYYAYIKGEIDFEDLAQHPSALEALAEAEAEARCAELGKTDPREIDGWISSALKKSSTWVLIGGPPCQAYSLVGRSRRRHDPAFADDEKHFLYKEYLRIIAKFRPSVFVMENVKGLLSSMHGGTSMIQRILDDLASPKKGLAYAIRSFVVEDHGLGHSRTDYIIESERYGVPQRRHRVILLGVLQPHSCAKQDVLAPHAPVDLMGVIQGLPRIRSKVSGMEDDYATWSEIVRRTPRLLKGWRSPIRASIEERMHEAVIAGFPESTGSSFDPSNQAREKGKSELMRWLIDPKLAGVVQHEARSHMPEDLQRYFFAACFAEVAIASPKIRDFPERLLPAHENVRNAEIPFEDRFRVQLRGSPSTTIVSHIAKDGHYYIHPDPTQCRSLTVREAARLQTFPDNYFFEGTRTEQYTQVGNAVPPFLARQLGRVVAQILGR